MSYIDGYVLAVPIANRETFIEYAKSVDNIFIEHGAVRVIEAFGDDVPHGEQTDFYKAVQAREDETVAFSWVEWPDKATRDAGMKSMMEVMEENDLFDQEKNPMPFDGARMILGSFQTVVEMNKVTSE
ncbi:MAG: DUF1428 domain-containing protein [Rhizobiales bacterium]|nr:DUF1428 domain-containing protein [Hyphomicrobiales bacterium]